MPKHFAVAEAEANGRRSEGEGCLEGVKRLHRNHCAPKVPPPPPPPPRTCGAAVGGPRPAFCLLGAGVEELQRPAGPGGVSKTARQLGSC